MKKNIEKIKVKAIDMKTMVSINEALKREKDPYIKAAITILKSTGMRRGELLELTIDCINQINNIYTITWTDSKIQSNLENDEKIYIMCVPAECAVAIKELTEATKERREQADISIKHFLFLSSAKGLRSNEIKRLTPHQFQNRLKTFARHNIILDANGEPLNLTSNLLRHTFFTYLIANLN